MSSRSGKVLNPLTGRWIDPNGKTAKRMASVLKQQNTQKTQKEKENTGKILSPRTTTFANLPHNAVNSIVKHMSPKTKGEFGKTTREHHERYVKPSVDKVKSKFKAFQSAFANILTQNHTMTPTTKGKVTRLEFKFKVPLKYIRAFTNMAIEEFYRNTPNSYQMEEYQDDYDDYLKFPRTSQVIEIYESSDDEDSEHSSVPYSHFILLNIHLYHPDQKKANLTIRHGWNNANWGKKKKLRTSTIVSIISVTCEELANAILGKKVTFGGEFNEEMGFAEIIRQFFLVCYFHGDLSMQDIPQFNSKPDQQLVDEFVSSIKA